MSEVISAQSVLIQLFGGVDEDGLVAAVGSVAIAINDAYRFGLGEYDDAASTLTSQALYHGARYLTGAPIPMAVNIVELRLAMRRAVGAGMSTAGMLDSERRGTQ